MIVLLDFCSLPWWLPWLLPFLLGLALGWLLWSKYKQMSEELTATISQLETRILGLEEDLNACKKARSEADGNVALLRGRIREIEASAASGKSGAVALSAVPVGRASSGDRYFTAIGTENLQIIEGVGPKMESVLIENGIRDFATLASKSSAELRTILNQYGEKYNIIDPTTWPQQADMAHRREWSGLIELQKALDTGRSDTVAGETDSKLEKFLIKAKVLRRWRQDDLKAVEGIGPKIEELLNNAGINTWRALSESSVERIQEVLTAAGPRYSLADPGTWPKQAALAADGKWDELAAYQDYLQGGKDIAHT